MAVQVAGGSNSMKVIYFPMALETAPLTWLETLAPNSIDSWDDLKKAFMNNVFGDTGVGAEGSQHSSTMVCGRMNESRIVR